MSRIKVHLEWKYTIKYEQDLYNNDVDAQFLEGCDISFKAKMVCSKIMQDHFKLDATYDTYL